jgi:hypothetical protein
MPTLRFERCQFGPSSNFGAAHLIFLNKLLFSVMKQENIVSKKEREVRRRPVFVSKQQFLKDKKDAR